MNLAQICYSLLTFVKHNLPPVSRYWSCGLLNFVMVRKAVRPFCRRWRSLDAELTGFKLKLSAWMRCCYSWTRVADTLKYSSKVEICGPSATLYDLLGTCLIQWVCAIFHRNGSRMDIPCCIIQVQVFALLAVALIKRLRFCFLDCRLLKE